ncbi:hypothetical protein AB8E32_07255 [Marinomonas polaris]|uniref:hypothetical protein n=1 Tax=Marinomonas polaris TaxID=293552 RepID=UPI003514E0EB
MISRISLTTPKSKIKISTPNSKIIISSFFPSKFKKHYDFKQSNNEFPNSNPKAYSWVSIHIKARCIFSAAEIALGELNYYLGIINLFYNRNSSRESFGKPSAINKIRKYPYHSLHLTDGSRATPMYWYEKSFCEIGSSQNNDQQFKEINKLYRELTKDIIKTKRYNFFQSVFDRYTEALENNDMTKSFLNLWSILETLTLTEKNNYDTTIKRTLILFRDKFLCEQKLNLLRNKRNMSIHTGKQHKESEKLTYMLMNFVNEYIFFMVNVMKITNNDEIIKTILELPPEKEKIKQIEIESKETIKNLDILRSLINLS